jgi:hypothetical protein
MSPVEDKIWALSLRTFKIADCTLLTDKSAVGTHQEDNWSRLDRHEIDLVLGWYGSSVVDSGALAIEPKHCVSIFACNSTERKSDNVASHEVRLYNPPIC